MKNLFSLLLVLFITFSVNANVWLPQIFSDHMVLQQNQPVRVWGRADSGEKITVELNGRKASTNTSRNGTWRITLPAFPAGGPFNLVVAGKNHLVFTDVMIGEVWLCAGQSNMQFELKSEEFADSEIPNSANPQLRQFKIPNTMRAEPADSLEGGSWQLASPATSGAFSAVAYYYGKKLSESLHVTVGLINASWGGTFIEGWMSYDALHALPDYSSYHQLTDGELESWFVSTERKYDELYQSLGIADRNNIREDSAHWLAPAFDDGNWPTVKLPQRFDYSLLPRFDGTVWFRREIDLPDDVAGKGMTIQLGRIDDNDITYINGHRVGTTNGVYRSRSYAVSPAILKPGKNLIVIRVHDYWERGGFLDSPDSFRVAAGSWSQGLAGDWKMMIGKQTFMWVRTPNVHPNLIFNGMLHPILAYSFKGAIWYQGENNVLFAKQYREVLPELIKDWRSKFSNGDFPFYVVQLPNMNSINSYSQQGGSDWAELRESQTAALNLPNTGMAVTIDLGDSTNVHPTNKTQLANRLALLALKNTYHQQLGEIASPVPGEVLFQGDRAVVRFRNTGSGLVARDRYGYLRGFELAGADRKFHFAQARIEGDEVVVVCNQVLAPASVRYAWSSNPSDANLYNQEGFPASPFRSDDWELNTEGFSYQNWIR